MLRQQCIFLDGIITLEPHDFASYPSDIETIREEGQASVLVGEIESIDGETTDEIRILVETPDSFAETSQEDLDLVIEDYSGVYDRLPIIQAVSGSLVRLAISDWNLVVSKDGLERMYIELEDQSGNRQFTETDIPTEELAAGEISALFAAIEDCAKKFSKIPSFYLSHSMTSRQSFSSVQSRNWTYLS